jgi:hypothetical protein
MVDARPAIAPLGNTPGATSPTHHDTPHELGADGDARAHGDGDGHEADRIDIAGRRAAQEALRLAARGYVLIPVTVRRDGITGKKAAEFHRAWSRGGSSDAQVIRDWSVQHPGCSFAILCGPSGVEVVDLDLHEGGPAWWAAQRMPESPVIVDTPSGGVHHYFRRGPVDRLVNNAGVPAPGVDARTVGGVVFAPGSYVLGPDGMPEERPYVARTELPEPDKLPLTPARVLGLWAAARTAPERSVPAGVPDPTRGFTPEEAAAYVNVEARAPLLRAEFGINVNDTLNRAALVLGHFVPEFWSQDAARDALAGWLLEGPGARNGWTDLDESDARSIDSGLAAGMREPYSRRIPPGSNPLPVLEAQQQPAGIPLEMLQGLAGPVAPADPLEDGLERERLRRLVRRMVDAEERPPQPPPSSTGLAALLAEPPGAAKYRIAGLWPLGGKVLMSAGRKAGKTTMVGNLVRSLADGAPFLAQPGPVAPGSWVVAAAGHAVEPLNGRRIMLMDFEMTRDMLREWLRDQRISTMDAVRVELMRGRSWDPRDERQRSSWATYLAGQEIGVLIVDPIGPILSALGVDESSSTEVGAVLWALDALCLEAGIGELFVTHHAGHDGERARGTSGFGAWPDALWELVRDKSLEGGGKRALRAEGRDVYLAETVLEFDRAARRLHLGQGSRAAARNVDHAEVIAAMVREECADRGAGSPGPTVRDLKRDAVDAGITRGPDAQDAVTQAVRLGLVHVHIGARNAHHHHPGPFCDGDPECPKNVAGLAKPASDE